MNVCHFNLFQASTLVLDSLSLPIAKKSKLWKLLHLIYTFYVISCKIVSDLWCLICHICFFNENKNHKPNPIYPLLSNAIVSLQ